MENWRDNRSLFAALMVPPTFWLVLFFTLPLALVWIYSFGERGPQGQTLLAFSFANYARALEWIHLGILFKSLAIAALTTAISLLIGLPVAWLHYGLLAFLSATIVAMLSSVGIILSVAYLIAPGAIAFLLTRRFIAMMQVAVAVALAAGVAGTYASFWLDSAPAPTIVLIMTAMFLTALVTRRR